MTENWRGKSRVERIDWWKEVTASHNLTPELLCTTCVSHELNPPGSQWMRQSLDIVYSGWPPSAQSRQEKG